MHSARNAYATLTLCALTLGFAPRPRVSRCTRLRLSPDRDELRKLRVKELQAELGKRKRLESRDGKRHRRMESAPVRSGAEKFFVQFLKSYSGRPPRPKRRHRLYTHPRTRSEPSPAPNGRETK